MFLLVAVCSGIAAMTADAAERRDDPHSLDFGLDIVRQAAAANPGAAIALLLFHPDYATLQPNLLQGRLAIPGAPTGETVDLMIERASERAVLASMGELEPGTFIDVRWWASEVDDETLRITIESELTDVDTLAGKGMTGPAMNVLLGKHPPRVLSVSPRETEAQHDVAGATADPRRGNARPMARAQPDGAASAGAGALVTLEKYVRAELDRDPETMVKLWHEDYVSIIGGESASRQRLEHRFDVMDFGHPLPMKIALGRPVVTEGSRFTVALVPARLTVMGFPRDSRTTYVYPMISDDGGRTWHVIELSCPDEAWLDATLAGVRWRELVGSLKGRHVEPVAVLRSNRLSLPPS